MRVPADHETTEPRTPRSVRPTTFGSARHAGPQGVRVASAPASPAALPLYAIRRAAVSVSDAGVQRCYRDCAWGLG
jgi:hypothetical protein